MSGLVDKAKQVLGGSSDTTQPTTSTQPTETLPGNIVEAAGGTYDAGPGVKKEGSNLAPNVVSDPHNTSRGISADPKTGAAQGDPNSGSNSLESSGAGSGSEALSGSGVKRPDSPATGGGESGEKVEPEGEGRKIEGHLKHEEGKAKGEADAAAGKALDI